MIPLYEIFRLSKYVETESRLMVAVGWEVWVGVGVTG